MQSTVARIGDHEEEIESDAEIWPHISASDHLFPACLESPISIITRQTLMHSKLSCTEDLCVERALADDLPHVGWTNFFSFVPDY